MLLEGPLRIGIVDREEASGREPYPDFSLEFQALCERFKLEHQ